MGKDDRLHFRLDPEARKKLQRACELTGLDEPTALRACIQAFIEHIEQNGGIWLPLAIVPKASTDAAEVSRKSPRPSQHSSPLPHGVGRDEKETCPREEDPVPRVRGPARGAPISFSRGDSMHGLNESPADENAKSGPHPKSTRGIKKVVAAARKKSS